MYETSSTSHPGEPDHPGVPGHEPTTHLDTSGEDVQTGAPDTGRHPLNVTHLVMGIVFAGIVGIWAAVAGDVVGGDDVRWLLPVPWVLAGVAGLLAITFGGRRSDGGDQQHR